MSIIYSIVTLLDIAIFVFLSFVFYGGAKEVRAMFDDPQETRIIISTFGALFIVVYCMVSIFFHFALFLLAIF